MFSTSGLFSSVPCPEKFNCKRVQCPFSHSPQATQPRLPHIPTVLDTPTSSVPISTPKVSSPIVPSKRALGSPISTGTLHSRGHESPVKEPPQKLPKLTQTTLTAVVKSIPGSLSRGRSSVRYLRVYPMICMIFAVLTVLNQSGAPLLSLNAAQSRVALPVRQVRTLPYSLWTILY